MIFAWLLTLLDYYPPDSYIETKWNLKAGGSTGIWKQSLRGNFSHVIFFDAPYGVVIIKHCGWNQIHIGLSPPDSTDYVTKDWYVYDCDHEGVIMMGNHRGIVEFFATEYTSISYSAWYMSATPGPKEFTQLKFLPSPEGEFWINDIGKDERVGIMLSDTNVSGTLRIEEVIKTDPLQVRGYGQYYERNITGPLERVIQVTFEKEAIWAFELRNSGMFEGTIYVNDSYGDPEHAYPDLNSTVAMNNFGLWTVNGTIEEFGNMAEVPERHALPDPEGPDPPGLSPGALAAICVFCGGIVIGIITVIVCIVRKDDDEKVSNEERDPENPNPFAEPKIHEALPQQPMTKYSVAVDPGQMPVAPNYVNPNYVQAKPTNVPAGIVFHD